MICQFSEYSDDPAIINTIKPIFDIVILRRHAVIGGWCIEPNGLAAAIAEYLQQFSNHGIVVSFDDDREVLDFPPPGSVQ
jgi:hypothetical protein